MNIPKILLVFLLGIVAISALAGGTGLILSSIQGKEMVPAEYLKNTPFDSTFIPGIILFLFIGVFPIITIYGLVSGNKSSFFSRLNLYHDRHWSFAYSIYAGIILLLWLTFELFMIGYNILQFVYMLLGIAIIILALHPHNFYGKR